MSSPTISHSNSAPNITKSPHLLSHSGVHKSVHSIGSLAKSWPKKLGEFIKRKGSPSSKNTGLTEENLQEFNTRNAMLETGYSKYSPYYKGLTDFSLDIKREKQSGSSPGRESHAATFVSSASKSSFVVKVQKGRTSCYTGKNREKSSSSSSSFWSRSKGHTHGETSDSTSSRATAVFAIYRPDFKLLLQHHIPIFSQPFKHQIKALFSSASSSTFNSPCSASTLLDSLDEPPSVTSYFSHFFSSSTAHLQHQILPFFSHFNMPEFVYVFSHFHHHQGVSFSQGCC